jgi:hypothetical protein
MARAKKVSESIVADDYAGAVTITAPRISTATFHLRGTAPFMQARFSQKAMAAMAAKMQAGSTAKGKRVREARDFDQDFEDAKHVSIDGWCGIPAGAFRAAMISACRLVGFKMTLAKLSVFIEHDGLDRVDQTPLVRIIGEPIKNTMPVRNANMAFDLRVRPLWPEWSCKLRVRFDSDQFRLEDVANLLHRVGEQVGIGEGRPDSRQSIGLGYGLFEIVSAEA